MHNHRIEGELNVSMYFRRSIKIIFPEELEPRVELEIGERKIYSRIDSTPAFSENYLTQRNMRFLREAGFDSFGTKLN